MPEAAPQAETCGPAQIYGLETTFLQVCFRSVLYCIVASGHVGPLLRTAAAGLLDLVAPHGSFALHSPNPQPRQGRGGPREWGLTRFMISLQEYFEKELS